MFLVRSSRPCDGAVPAIPERLIFSICGVEY